MKKIVIILSKDVCLKIRLSTKDCKLSNINQKSSYKCLSKTAKFVEIFFVVCISVATTLFRETLLVSSDGFRLIHF